MHVYFYTNEFSEKSIKKIFREKFFFPVSIVGGSYWQSLLIEIEILIKFQWSKPAGYQSIIARADIPDNYFICRNDYRPRLNNEWTMTLIKLK